MALIDQHIEYSLTIQSYVKTKDNQIRSFNYIIVLGEEDTGNTIQREDTYTFNVPQETDFTLDDIFSRVVEEEKVEDFESCSIFKKAIEEFEIGDKTCLCSFGITNIS